MKYNKLLTTATISSMFFSSLFLASNPVEATTANEAMIQQQEQLIQESTERKAQLLEQQQTFEQKQTIISNEIHNLQNNSKENKTDIETLKKLTSLTSIPTDSLEKEKKILLDTSIIPFKIENDTNESIIQQNKRELLHKEVMTYISDKAVLDNTHKELAEQVKQLTQVIDDSTIKKETLKKEMSQKTNDKTAIVAAAKTHLGKPYVYGAAGPDAFDCSGLVQIAFASVGRSLGRTTVDQESAGTTISVSEAQAGDLVFWGSAGGTYHVGISLGDGTYIHAPVPGDLIKITSVAEYSPDFAVRV